MSSRRLAAILAIDVVGSSRLVEADEADALGAVRGTRAPGFSLPGRTKIGTWRGRGRRTFVVARRDVPAVRFALAGAKDDELIVSTPDADAVAARIRKRAGLV